VHDARGPGRQGAGRKQPDRQPVDDWFGDVSDQDWNEDAAELGEQRRATPGREERSTPETRTERNGRDTRPAQDLPVTTDARRAAVRRRRLVAGLVLLLLIGLAAVSAAVLLRDDAEPSATPTPEPPIVAPPTPAETDPAPPPPSPTPAPPAPAAPSEDVTTFTLPEGTKLQRGESTGESDLTVSTDPELIAELQRALASAGFDPGSPDGSFGENTEAAVIAFQQANGLSPDGIVGPETAAALSSAIAGG
jgi:hypothetical protein